MSQFTEVLTVITSWPRKPYPCPPPRWGSLGLMVATANSGFAVAGITSGGGGGSGMAQAVSLVARTRFNGRAGPPCVQFPLMVLPSPLRVPSNAPFNCVMEIFTAELLSVIVVALMGVGF